jgi:hypothetical protein
MQLEHSASEYSPGALTITAPQGNADAHSKIFQLLCGGRVDNCFVGIKLLPNTSYSDERLNCSVCAFSAGQT